MLSTNKKILDMLIIINKNGANDARIFHKPKYFKRND